MSEAAEGVKVSFCPLTPAYEVRGDILEKWNSLGGKDGKLGYPIETEMEYRDEGRSMQFQRGSIYSHPTHGTWYIEGKFYRYWADELGVYGPYSYPTSDPVAENGVTVQHFVGGELRSDLPVIRDRSDLRGEIERRGIGIRAQGKRGTCSVHVMVFLMEYQYTGLLGREFAHLSVEYANHAANLAEDLRNDGQYFSSVAAGYEKYGIVKESVWPYNREWPYDYDQAVRIVDEEMQTLGRRMLTVPLKLQGRFVKEIGGPGLSDAQFEEILSLLDRGIPVGLGRDHSLSLVGYCRNASQPGGGTFYFKNSWGTNLHFNGYQTETFQHVKDTVFDAYVYEPVL